jgi:hypothetical protein
MCVSFLIFLCALLSIGIFAILLNYFTRTKANYLDALQLAPDEKQLWLDTQADFKAIQCTGRAAHTSIVRLKRDTVIWTNHRIIVARKTLFSDKRMITHQIYFDRSGVSTTTTVTTTAAMEVARKFSGGFLGRGYQTIMAQNKAFGQFNAINCLRIQPTAACSAAQNIAEILIFTDLLVELEQRLALATQQG